MFTVIHLKIIEQDCISKLHTMENKNYGKYSFCLQKAYNLIQEVRQMHNHNIGLAKKFVWFFL